jgi:hypothetical protein
MTYCSSQSFQDALPTHRTVRIVSPFVGIISASVLVRILDVRKIPDWAQLKLVVVRRSMVYYALRNESSSKKYVL